jgi:hypothetical protein
MHIHSFASRAPCTLVSREPAAAGVIGAAATSSAPRAAVLGAGVTSRAGVARPQRGAGGCDTDALI